MLDPKDKTTWPWWWSQDEERYRGPCSSRTEALIEAFHEDATSAYIIQAYQGDLNYDVCDGSFLAERFDENNEESADGDGDSLSSGVPQAEWDKLGKSIEQQVRSLVQRQGVKPWAFTEQTGGEWVSLGLPMIAALPEHARNIIAELATQWTGEFPWAESYVSERMEELRFALAKTETEPTDV